MPATEGRQLDHQVVSPLRCRTEVLSQFTQDFRREHWQPGIVCRKSQHGLDAHLQCGRLVTIDGIQSLGTADCCCCRIQLQRQIQMRAQSGDVKRSPVQDLLQLEENLFTSGQSCSGLP